MSDFLINAGLILTYIMIGTAALAAVIYPLLFLAKNPSKGKAALMGVGGLLHLHKGLYFEALSVHYQQKIRKRFGIKLLAFFV